MTFAFRTITALLLCSHHVAGLSSLKIPDGFSLHPSASIVNLSGTERGVTISKSPIEPKETLLVIPLQHIIQPEQGRQTPAGMAVHRHCCAVENSSTRLKELMTEQTYIALWLCDMVTERRSDATTAESIFFLDTLPDLNDLTHIPMFWSEEDLVELQGSTMLLETRKNRRNWKELYQEIAACRAPFGDHTSLDTFLWAQALTRSRTFSLRGEYFEGNNDDIADKQRRFGMVPILDMLNHRSRSDPNTCDWKFDVDRNAFVVQVAETMHPGSEACISYGLYPNRYYLSSYGFTIAVNCRHDGASPNEAHIQLDPAAVVGAATTTQNSFAVTIGDANAATALLSAFRLSVATEEGKLPALLDSTAASAAQELHWDLPYSLQNEQAAMKKLKLSIGTAVRRYQTSLDDDLALLARKSKSETDDSDDDDDNYDDSFHLPVGSNHRNSVVVRSGEKHVLRHWQYLCDASLCCLDDVKDGSMGWNNYCDLLEETCQRFKSIAP
jgi:hypothetical protein